jgi:recombination protein RecT
MPRTEKLLHGWHEPVATRPAATILLMRDAQDGPEVLMTRRSATASFAPGAYVFPGGTLDPADASPAARGVSRIRHDQDDDQLTFATAAVREAFEELGVLLAWQRGSEAHCSPELARTLDRSTEGDFYARIAAASLELAVDRAFWLSHWVTDRDLPKRFDVRFFVAQMPGDQHASADETEQFEPVWIRPSQALERHERGEFNIIFPTVRTLRQLRRYARVEQVLDACLTQSGVYFSCPRGGWLGGKVERFTEDEMPYGELELTAPDGQIVHTLDWQSERPVRLLANVQRLTAPNPGVMTGPGTNTYIVGEPGDYLVIDPGPALATHIERIAAVVGDDLHAIVCTHSHPDHSPGALLLKQAAGNAVPIYGLPSGPGARPNSSFTPDRMLHDGETLQVADSTLRAVHTPGHAANHLCLVLEEDRLLFSGDHVLNGSTTVVDPPDGNMKDYLDSLGRLAREPVDYILPAHGHVLAPALAAIERLIAHRRGREAKVAAVLERIGQGTLEELVPLAYDDVRPGLYPVAMRSLLAHLEKLESDGRATRSGTRWLHRNPDGRAPDPG